MIARFQPPPALHPRDRVAVIAPASAFDRPSFEAGLALIGARYRAGYGPGVFERQRYLAGDDARRLGELTAALSDPDVRAVFCARGGYGATRLLARLAATGPPGPPKLLVGFSDITSLHLWLQTLGRSPWSSSSRMAPSSPGMNGVPMSRVKTDRLPPSRGPSATPPT